VTTGVVVVNGHPDPLPRSQAERHMLPKVSASIVRPPPGESVGAYGFRVAGVPEARALLVEAPSHWPLLELAVRVSSDVAPAREGVDQRTAVLRPRSGGWVEIDRATGRVTFSLPERPSDGALVHPHLASVAVVSAHWLGRDAFHAGAFVAGGGVWALLGEREAGKSSLLASLARDGVPVFSDDVLVLDGSVALAGPRSVDLRASAAKHLEVGEALGVMGTRERWRLALSAVPAELPLSGWVALRWDDRAFVRPIQGSDRLRVLGANRGSTLYPPDPEALIELSALPFLELRRPRRWDSADDVLRRLLDAVH
jgi:hypothetical protein